MDRITNAILEQVKIIYERKYGRRYKEGCLYLLSQFEEEWLITEAGKEVNRIKGVRK